VLPAEALIQDLAPIIITGQYAETEPIPVGAAHARR
jgi:hypothetical protein